MIAPAAILLAQLAVANAAAPATPPASAPATVTHKRPPSDAEVRRGVRCARPGHCTVTRALVDKLVADVDALGSDVHVAPALVDGRPAGFQLSDIRRGSVFARLGLRDGDVVAAVNGMDVSTPAAAMLAFMTLRDATDLTVRIVRHGETQTLDYSIR